MLSGGLINVSTNFLKGSDQLDITFSDTGIGIPAQILQKLSDPNYASGLGSTERIGISLAVCKNIIEMHNGKFAIESNTDSGTSVFIKLPVSS